MSLRCKILGHDWHEFQQTTKVQIEAINNSHMSIPAMTPDFLETKSATTFSVPDTVAIEL